MNTKTEEVSGTHSLKVRWDDLKARNPKLRTKNAADELGVSEAELIASVCDGQSVVRLNEKWKEIINQVETLGEVMALTRNHGAVHEKTGTYQNVSFKAHAGVVLDDNIDLRVFHKRWGFAFALPVENPKGTLHSLQFFDKEGAAVHKIYLRKEDKLASYQTIVDTFRAEDQTPGIELKGTIKKSKTVSIQEVDAGELLMEWDALKDTHDFYPMLRKFKVARTDSLRLAEGKFSWKVPNHTTREMLQAASQREVPIMVFVGNKGMIQIHSGPVKRIKILNEWINILDPGFNLHLREDFIAESWVVEKPTEDGTIASLEVFDREGEALATFFGARKPGKPELPEWTQLAAEIKRGVK